VSDRLRTPVLVVDADATDRRNAADTLDRAGYVAAQSGSVADALTRLEGFAYDLLVVDVRLPDGDGLDVLEAARARYPTLPCIVTSQFGSIHHAVRAFKNGAAEYLIKPMSGEQLLDVVQKALTGRPTAAAAPPIVRAQKFRCDSMVGQSPAMRQLFDTLERVSPMQSTVLIQGETGTGKELVARTIHENSTRVEGPFVAFNAAAVPDGLAEAELFGHVKGAFTGAVYTRVGRFEAADRGTLFIDEVSSMSLSLQAKLLRALQEREIERVGTSRPLKVNVRVVAASNVDLEEMVRAGDFREDLFYRLNVVRVTLPPLRERQGDIPLLAQHFVEDVCDRNDLPEKHLTQGTLRALMAHSWPGNIRHLQNAIECAVAMSGSATEIDVDLLPEDIRHPARGLRVAPAPVVVEPAPVPQMPDEGVDFASTMAQVERELLLKYLGKAGGNKRQAARMLRLSRTTLIDKLHRLGVAESPGIEAVA
jgi:two-component system response regulator AtoC